MKTNSTLSALLIGVVSASLVLNAPAVLWAANGPCVVTTPASHQNTIRCENGVCLGSVIVIVEQSACAGTAESECTNSPGNLRVDYQPKSVSLSAAELAAEVEMSLACAACCQ